jgi:endonuclease YncB( thermonuclease family)
MIETSTFRLFIIATALTCSAQIVSAVTLQGKVSEVRSGNILIVSNINRSISVRLKAVTPPEVGQPFNDAAREHLKALVLDKVVTVDYSHLADGHLQAKVFVYGVDVGSQMLRDGVAWYDHALDYELSQSDRDLYAQCETAARTERRGLWQDQSPVSPWEYRRLQAEQLAKIYSSPSLRQSTGKRAGLSSEDLFSGMMGRPAAGAGAPSVRPIADRGTPDRWTIYESVPGHFSVYVPTNSVAGTNMSLDEKTGKPVPFYFVTGGSQLGFFFAMSAVGPNNDYNDVSARDEAIQSIIKGMNQGARKTGTGPIITVKSERAVQIGSNTGMQYRLSADGFTGAARVFTQRVGNDRQIFLLFALSRPGAESLGNQFMNSFKIVQ